MTEGIKPKAANDNYIDIHQEGHISVGEILDPIQNILERASGIVESLKHVIDTASNELMNNNNLTQKSRVGLFDVRNDAAYYIKEINKNKTLLESADRDKSPHDVYTSFLLHEITQAEELVTGTASHVLPISPHAKMALKDMFGHRQHTSTGDADLTIGEKIELTDQLNFLLESLNTQKTYLEETLAHQATSLSDTEHNSNASNVDVHIIASSLEYIKSMRERIIWLINRLTSIKTISTSEKTKLSGDINKSIKDAKLFLDGIKMMKQENIREEGSGAFKGDHIMPVDPHTLIDSE